MSEYDIDRNDSSSMLLSPPPNGRERASTSGTKPGPPVRSEMLPSTRSAIERFADRRAWLQRLRGVASGLVCLLVGMLLLVLVEHFVSMTMPVRIATSVLVYLGAFVVAWLTGLRQSRLRDWATIARGMETATPPLRERLLSAVELEDPRVASGSIDFRSSLQASVASDLSSVDIRRMLPWKLVRRSVLAVCAVLLGIGLLGLVPSLQLPRRLARVFAPIAPIERASITRLSITAPTPPTRSVAEGDLIAVAVSVARLGRGGVTLQWQSDDGRKGVQVMAPRDDRFGTITQGNGTDGDSVRDEDAERQFFSANVQVDTTPLHYRVIAGDAETLWHTLGPMPRPRIVSFEKRYAFSPYTKLSDAVAVEDFGDLEALVGTRADVTVTFDQPVRDADVWFGESSSGVGGVPMNPVEGDPTRFRFQVAIKTPGSYRVDAVSLESELNNPFLPRYVIDPVFDRAPLAAWSPELQARQIASSAAVLKLSGNLTDDLPMDRYFLQYSLDDGPLRERVVPLLSPTMQAIVPLEWDLMDLNGDGNRVEALPPGSRLRTRLVSIDRANQRGESPWIEIYVGGENFDPDRHDPLLAFHEFASRMTPWFSDARSLIDEIKAAGEQAKRDDTTNNNPPDEKFLAELNELEKRWMLLAGPMDAVGLREKLNQRLTRETSDSDAEPLALGQMMFSGNDSISSDRWSLLDRFAMSTIRELRNAVSRLREAYEIGDTLPTQERQRAASNLFETARDASGVAKQAADLTASLLATELGAGLMRDMEGIRQSAGMLSSEDSSIPIERLPGQADLLAERMRQVESLIASVEDGLDQESLNHLKNFRRFVDESVNRIEQARDQLQSDRNPNVEKMFRDSIAQWHRDMQQHSVGSWVHGNTFNRVVNAIRDFSRDQQQNQSTIGALLRAGRDRKDTTERLRRATEKQDSTEIAQAAAAERLRLRALNDRIVEAVQQYARAEASETVRGDSQIRTASDFRLVRRVIEHVSENGFVAIADETPEAVFERIEKAARILESGGLALRFANQLQDFVDRERYGTDRPDRAIRQGMRLEHYQVAAETPLQQLRSTEVNNTVFDDLQSSRWDQDYSQARDWTTRRRYDRAPFVSAAAPAQSMVNRFASAQPVILAAMKDARATLQAFLPSTSDLAREAAQEAKKQSEPEKTETETPTAETPPTETPPTETPPTETPPAETDESPPLDQLQEKVDRLAEDLVDRANTADLGDPAQRELARDADAALGKIQQQMEAVAAPIRQAEKAAADAPAPDVREQLEQLAETLEQTALHFEAADSGQDLSPTREALRATPSADEDAAPMPDPVEMARNNAASTSELARTSPEELLKRLEKQLQRDVPMQENLSQIASQTVTDAQQAVQTAADQEKRLQRELEKADPKLAEQNRALRDQLRSLSDQARAVNDQWVSTAENASGRERNENALSRVRQMRQELRAASDQADRVQNDDALLQEIRSASEQLQGTLQDASQQSKDLREQAQKASEQESEPNENTRLERARHLEAEQRRTQNEWVKLLERGRRDWQNRKDEANRRKQQSDNQQRDAEKKLGQAEKQLQDNPQQEWARKNERETRQRVQEAALTSESAEQTRRIAEQQEKQAAAQTEQAKQQSVAKLEAKNPNAELLARAAETSRQELNRLSEELGRLQEQAETAEASAPRKSAAESIARDQGQIRQTVRQAAEDLLRAARHEERLGNPQAADRLDTAAEQLQNTLDSPMQQAQDKLNETAQADQESTPTAAKQSGENLNAAAEQLAAQAESLANWAQPSGDPQELANAQSPQNPRDESRDESAANLQEDAPESTGTFAETDRSEKLARALDELDRALNEMPASASQSSEGNSAQGEATEGEGAAGEAGEGQQADGQNPNGQTQNGQNANGQNSSGQNGQQPGQQPPSSGQASPTLAGAAEQALRDLAARRQQRLNQIAAAGQPQSGDPSGQPGEPGQPGDPNAPDGPPSDQPGTPGSQSGESTQMPGGGLLSLDGDARQSGEWGELRERKNDDMIQDRKSTVPLNYRPAIEAYFQAIAAEAARSGGQPKNSSSAEDSK